MRAVHCKNTPSKAKPAANRICWRCRVESLFFGGMKGEVWIQPGKLPSQVCHRSSSRVLLSCWLARLLAIFLLESSKAAEVEQLKEQADIGLPDDLLLMSGQRDRARQQEEGALQCKQSARCPAQRSLACESCCKCRGLTTGQKQPERSPLGRSPWFWARATRRPWPAWTSCTS